MKPTLLFLSISFALWAAEEPVPGWVRTAALVQTPAVSSKVDAVVLMREEEVTVEADGKRVMRERGVIRWLSTGRNGVRAIRDYNTKSGRIRDFRGWVLPAGGGKEVHLGKERILDAATAEQGGYDEYRFKVLAPGTDLQKDGVFAYEVTEEEKTVFTQYSFQFQEGRVPVVESRFVLNLPAGWEARGRILNAAEQQPEASGTPRTWTLKNLPWIEDEESGPELHELNPRLVVTLFPANGSDAALRPLKDWTAVSAWITDLSTGQADVTPAIQKKSAELTQGAATELDKIRAIAQFVQKTTYISIQMNLARGGGYTPHKAEDVLQHNYGDCKDKANLMKALLKAAGLDSYLVAIYSGARGYVRPEWPSTMQFNHMIIGVKVSAVAKAPTVLESPELGRILIFDPTDPYTPVGGLGEDEQGSYALVLAGMNGALLKMPLLAASSNRIETLTEAQMDERGAVVAKVRRDYYGQTGSGVRGITVQRNDDELRKSLERSLARRLGGLQLKDFNHLDQVEEGRMTLNLNFAANQVGKSQSKLLIFSPAAMLAETGFQFAAKERTLPVRLTAEVRKDRVVVQLPPNFAADEIPEPVKLTSAYGTYSASWKVEGGAVAFEQSMEVEDALAPASEYSKVREFFGQVQAAAAQSVVLVRK